MTEDLKLIRFPGRSNADPIKPDNSCVTSMLRDLADRLDADPHQLSGVAVVTSYASGEVGTQWAGDEVLDLLKGLTVLRVRLEREIE